MHDLIEALIAGRITDLDAALAEAGARHARVDRDRLHEILKLVALVLGDDADAATTAKAELDALEPQPVVAESVQRIAEAAGMSLTDLMEKLRGAVRAESPMPMVATATPAPMLYVEDVFDDYIVVEDESSERMWKRSYSVAADGTITLGDPVEVREQTTYLPIAEAGALRVEKRGTKFVLCGPDGDMATFADEFTANTALVKAKAKAKAAESSDAPAAHSLVESDSLLLEAVEPEGKVIDVLAIRAGRSQNRKVYRPAVLQEAVTRGVFDGAKAFASEGRDHFGARGVKALVGWWDGARYGTFALPNGGTIEGVASHFHPTDPALRNTLREAIEGGRPDLIGFSIFGDGPLQKLPNGDFDVTRIDVVESIDPVIHPAAGGQALRLIASVEGSMNTCPKCGVTIAEGATHTCLAESIDAAVAARLAPIETRALVESEISARAGMPDAVKARIRTATAGKALDAAAVTALVESEVAYAASFAPARVTGAGPTIEPGQDERAKMVEAISDVLDGKAHSIRRVYEDLTGDRSLTGKLQESGRITESRLTESAIISTTFPLMTQEAMHKRLLAEYAKPGLDDWRKIVSAITPVTDFRDRKGIRIGGYGDLPIVAERGDYTALAEPGEEQVTIPKAVKRGGTEDLTMEAIANDDVAGFRRIPTSLARSAKRTLNKAVWAVLSGNMVYTGDSKALFHADHANLGAAAFAAASLAAGRLAMLKQQEPGTLEPIGIVPKFLAIPSDLTETVMTLLKTPLVTGVTAYNFAGSIIDPSNVIEVPHWTDTNNWYLVGDPTQYDTIEVCFFNGREEPELLLQDQPNVGDNFIKDVLTYKIRHIWSVGLLDTKPFYGAIVA
jgi:hypothetical protein